MKITLILAAALNDPLKKNEPFMPLSLPLLAASAPNHEYTFVDMLSGDKINYDKPVDIVGISARQSAENMAYQIANEFKKRNIKVVLGGAQISAVPFRAIKNADVVAVGEGETLWPVILEDFKKDKLKDFYVCSSRVFNADNYSVCQTKSYVNLKSISPPLRNIYKKKYRFDTVFAARGCQIDCDFCSVPSLFGANVRFREIKDVVEEIDTFKNYYYLLDDTVFGRPSNYKYYKELYEEIARLKKKRFWVAQANLDAASTKDGREVIKKAAKSGLVYAAIGMESINPSVLRKGGMLKKMGAKSETNVILSMKENINFIQQQGIIVSGWFTIGYEEDTIDTYYKTLEFCKETKIIPVINHLIALPDTRLYNRLNLEGKVDEKRRYNIIHSAMDDKQIEAVLDNVARKGYSFKEIIKRTFFYFKMFERDNLNRNMKIYNKIHKTIFALVLQHKIKKGVACYIHNK